MPLQDALLWRYLQQPRADTQAEAADDIRLPGMTAQTAHFKNITFSYAKQSEDKV